MGGNLEQQPQPGCKKGSARVRGVGGDGCGAVATAGWIEGSTLPEDKIWGLKRGIFSPFSSFNTQMAPASAQLDLPKKPVETRGVCRH